jgi:hypothetical protein
MSRARFTFAVAAALAATAACSLAVDLSGLSEPEPVDAGGPGSEAASDASVEAAPDGASDALPGTCTATTVIDTPLTSTLGTWTPLAYNQAGNYPKVESFFGDPAAVLIAFVDTTPIPNDARNSKDAAAAFYVPPERQEAVGGLWQTTPVPLRAFDVELEVLVKCTSGNSCADGVAFAWLDEQTVSPPTGVSTGHVQGLPPGVSGAAVLLDDYRNTVADTDDPATPSIELVQLDKDKTLGHYAWVTSSKATPFLATWHKLSISLRTTTVTVGYDGTPWLVGTAPAIARGVVAITAGTGGLTDAVAVRNVKASFYDCAPP